MKNRPPKRHGDRRDAYMIHSSDPLHLFMPYLLGKRTDNEAVMNTAVDLTAAEEYLARRNAEEPQYRYTLFHLICAAIAKTIALRPKMNYFIQNGRLYERTDISFAFVAKNKFADSGSESLVILRIDEEEGAPAPVEQVHDKVCAEVYKVRNEKETDGTTEQLGWMTKLPRFLLKLLVKYILHSDQTGHLPAFLSEVNPYEASVFITNLGSIKMSASYHHLTNFGTNSFFVIMGEKHPSPLYDENGNVEMRPTLELGLTIDERIGDGFYFARSLKLVKYLLANPALLERPLYEPVEWQE